MVRLDRIVVYPIKSLDGVSVDAATLTEGGRLAWDRRYAIVDAEGAYVNGKRERAVHRLRAEYDLERGTVTIEAGGPSDAGDSAAGSERGDAYHLETEREELEAWLSEYFGYPVTLQRDERGGFPDDTDAAGPTVLSTGTLPAVASWFDDIDADSMRRRLRPNLLLESATPFWEDRLYDRPETVVPFRIGEVELRGVNPCQRCVVPTRDPDTGKPTPDFRTQFVEQREATLPDWASRAWFDHYFRLMVNTRVPQSSCGSVLEVGDAVAVEAPISSQAK